MAVLSPSTAALDYGHVKTDNLEMNLRGRVEKGVVVLDRPAALPDTV